MRSSQVRWVDVSDPAGVRCSERMLDRIDAALNYDGHCRFGLSRCRRKSSRPATGTE